MTKDDIEDIADMAKSLAVEAARVRLGELEDDRRGTLARAVQRASDTLAEIVYNYAGNLVEDDG